MTVRIVRWGIPAIVAIAGIVIVVLGHKPVGTAVICVAPCLALAGWLMRLSQEDVIDRNREEEARVFMDEHGHWPDEEPTA